MAVLTAPLIVMCGTGSTDQSVFVSALYIQSEERITQYARRYFDSKSTYFLSFKKGGTPNEKGL